MPEWDGVKKSARKIAPKPRAITPAVIEENERNFRALSDRLPRPGAVGVVAKPKPKQGREISGSQMAALKSGSMKIDARLDLHGMTQKEALSELTRFMKKQIPRGARLLLIITGKGKNNEGVLRLALPGWLMDGAFRHDVLTIHPAHQKHGGDGATYVLLRRVIPDETR